MMFLQLLLEDFYNIWRSFGEPKAKRASWSNQWTNMTRTLEGVARDVANHNCNHEQNFSLRSVVKPASVENISGTSALLIRKAGQSCQKEADVLILLDRLAQVAVEKACWAEVQRFFERPTHGSVLRNLTGDDTDFRYKCAAVCAREVYESNLQLKNVAGEAKQVLNDYEC